MYILQVGVIREVGCGCVSVLEGAKIWQPRVLFLWYLCESEGFCQVDRKCENP